MAADKPDFRNTLNTLLYLFYHSEDGVVAMQQVIGYRMTKLSPKDLNTAYDTLIQDGHIKHVHDVAGFREMRAGAITGQGRIFYEHGGYKDKTSYLDKLTEKAKNNRVLAWIAFIGIALTSTFGLIEIIISIVQALTNTTNGTP